MKKKKKIKLLKKRIENLENEISQLKGETKILNDLIVNCPSSKPSESPWKEKPWYIEEPYWNLWPTTIC